jgi:hypothetical protein
MTRAEAIGKIRSARVYGPAFVDALAELGVLKLDEPKPPEIIDDSMVALIRTAHPSAGGREP